MSKRLTDEEESWLSQSIEQQVWTYGDGYCDENWRLESLLESEQVGWKEVERLKKENSILISSLEGEQTWRSFMIKNNTIIGRQNEKLKQQLQEAHDALLELDKWYNDGVCTWEPHCPAELATIWRRAASIRQRIQEGIRCGTDN